MSPVDLRAYDRVVVAFSGGKDSLAALLHLLDLGVAPKVIELHHHLVDGQGPVMMDWPITPAYVAALADHFGFPLLNSWRDGGFRQEMDRDGVPTAPILFEQPGAPLGRAGGAGPPGVRGRFPQVSADLSVRWCSPALKIDVLAAALRGQARFEHGRTLVVTGERAEESPARARYRPFEPHRTDCGRRRVDHWRPVLDWTETRVWERIAAAMIRPHPAYSLGWSRLSCRCCIFGSPAQWATIRALYPAIFAEIAAREARSGRTIQRAASVVALADRGVPYPAALAQPELAALAAGEAWTLQVSARPWAVPTLDTKGGVWVVEPFIASVAHGASVGDATADSRRCKSLDDPLGTVHAGGGKFAVVEPFVLSQGAGGMARQTTQPIPAIPTHGAHALISPYYSNGWQQQSGSPPPCYTVEDPVPPITTRGRFGVVVPVTQSKRGNTARSTEEPIPTATTAKGGEFAIVMPVTHHDGSNRTRDVNQDPIPTPTGANRGELAFIAAQFGERPGQAPRTHSLEAPTPTIAATGHINLVEGVEGLEGYDILFRMLEPHELAAAMGFDGDGRHYTFVGTKTEQIKQIGNAVSVRKMKACVMALMADAVPRRRTSPPPALEIAA